MRSGLVRRTARIVARPEVGSREITAGAIGAGGPSNAEGIDMDSAVTEGTVWGVGLWLARPDWTKTSQKKGARMRPLARIARWRLAGITTTSTPAENTGHSVFVTMAPDCHKTPPAGVLDVVDAPVEAIVDVTFNEGRLANETRFDLETIFHAQYKRIARVIARVIRDPARAEELAVEVFLKWSANPNANGDRAEGWLYRTAVRTGLNELRRETRRSRHERLFGFISSGKASAPTPEDLRAAKEQSHSVRVVLSAIHPREAELLVLRSDGLSYEELASALDLNPASVGTLLARAQQAFRKEYIKRYGEA